MSPLPLVVLVGCGAKKLPTDPGETLPARRLYTSDLFRKSLAYTEAVSEHVYIVSAFYRAIDPDAQVSTYDVTMASQDPRKWGEVVCGTIAVELGHVMPQLEVLAGAAYASPIRAAAKSRGWPEPVEPLRGLAIGLRTKRLAAMLRGALEGKSR